jgi:hypothetical protein
MCAKDIAFCKLSFYVMAVRVWWWWWWWVVVVIMMMIMMTMIIVYSFRKILTDLIC